MKHSDRFVPDPQKLCGSGSITMTLLHRSYFVADFGDIGEGFSSPCKQVYACHHFIDYGGEARQAGQVPTYLPIYLYIPTGTYLYTRNYPYIGTYLRTYPTPNSISHFSLFCWNLHIIVYEKLQIKDEVGGKFNSMGQILIEISLPSNNKILPGA